MAAPTKKAILSTYRTLLRMSNPMFDGRRPRVNTLTGPFAEEIQSLYRENRSLSDVNQIKTLHRQASDLATMLTCSITHAEAVFDGGWCLNRVCLLFHWVDSLRRMVCWAL